MGAFAAAAAALGLISGGLRHEPVLTLFGAVLLAAWVYCLAAVALTAVLHRKWTGDPPPRRSPARLPGVLVRYEIDLSTRDGRRLHLVFDPDLPHDKGAPLRGAYYGKQDKLIIFDMIGLFQAAICIPQPPGPRLLVMPGAAKQALPPFMPWGGTGERTRFPRTGEPAGHRPYTPGDDPRRINWKLYGHAGELFVREGEREPPPRSRLEILIDTQTDGGLYTAEAGRRGVDLLCENALALALDCADRGMDAVIGYSGGGVSTGAPAELAAALAHPAALPLSGADELPRADEADGVLILALPRGWTGGGTPENGAAEPSLDRFLKKRSSTQAVDLLFLYGGEDASPAIEKCAEACARWYGGKGGVRARHIRL